MPIVITLVLLALWLVLAYRRLQAGDMVLAVIFLLAGIALTAYRLRSWQDKQSTSK